MENAADALKLAAFMLLFIGALSVGMIMLSKAKDASEAIVYTQDERNYYSFTSDDEVNKRATHSGNRYVTVESIIPTLYRYTIEEYRVEFYKRTAAGGIDKLDIVDNPNYSSKVNYLDRADELINNISPQDRKIMLDSLSEYLLNNCDQNTIFEEQLGVMLQSDDGNGDGIIDEDPDAEEDPYDVSDVNETEKRTIRYILQ